MRKARFTVHQIITVVMSVEGAVGSFTLDIIQVNFTHNYSFCSKDRRKEGF
ncbi:hypothetical protein OGV52_22645 [Citrobacter sp. Cb041]|uniref:hypothetical protein n=1 Tax=Citrobacter sp. Cb041 TaxID=2985028 RepID=UPI00257CF7C4|nr:hypothetical protein [Citrobacter sp. Cb041]MDM3470435.1 hypothetical protein [Citrobacter sp. Cb041]